MIFLVYLPSNILNSQFRKLVSILQRFARTLLHFAFNKYELHASLADKPCSKPFQKINFKLTTDEARIVRAWCLFAFTLNASLAKELQFSTILNLPQQCAILTQPHRTFILESRPKPPFLRHGGRDDDASLSSAAAAPSCGGGSRQLGHSTTYLLQLNLAA